MLFQYTRSECSNEEPIHIDTVNTLIQLITVNKVEPHKNKTIFIKRVFFVRVQMNLPFLLCILEKKKAAKTGKLLKRQQSVVTKATVGITATFIFKILSKMLNNVNHSKHFRNTIPMFWEIVENV